MVAHPVRKRDRGLSQVLFGQSRKRQIKGTSRQKKYYIEIEDEVSRSYLFLV